MAGRPASVAAHQAAAAGPALLGTLVPPQGSAVLPGSTAARPRAKPSTVAATLAPRGWTMATGLTDWSKAAGLARPLATAASSATAGNLAPPALAATPTGSGLGRAMSRGECGAVAVASAVPSAGPTTGAAPAVPVGTVVAPSLATPARWTASDNLTSLAGLAMAKAAGFLVDPAALAEAPVVVPALVAGAMAPAAPPTAEQPATPPAQSAALVPPRAPGAPLHRGRSRQRRGRGPAATVASAAGLRSAAARCRLACAAARLVHRVAFPSCPPKPLRAMSNRSSGCHKSQFRVPGGRCWPRLHCQGRRRHVAAAAAGWRRRVQLGDGAAAWRPTTASSKPLAARRP